MFSPKLLAFLTAFMMFVNGHPQTIKYNDIRPLSEVNTPDQSEAVPWISWDGLRLYYISGNFNPVIKYCERTDTSELFSAPVANPLGPVNATAVWLSREELDAYFIYNGVLLNHCHRDSLTGPWSEPELINLYNTGFGGYSSIYSISLNQAQNELYLAGYRGGNISRIMIYRRSTNTRFDFERDVTPA